VYEINCAWKGDMAFAAHVDGHEITLDAEPNVGGQDQGPRPKPFMLVSLAGCTGMDVVSILKKMREPVSWFNVRVQGELAEEHPKTYTAMKVIYEFKKADGLNEKNVEKAVLLSQDRYCGVSFLLKKAIPLTHEIVYL